MDKKEKEELLKKIEEYTNKIKEEPNNASNYFMIGRIYEYLENYDKAEKAFKNAFAFSGDGLYLYNRGIALRILERYEEAVEVLLQSRKISVQEGDVTDGEDLDLARCYVALKDKKNAEKYLDLAREGLENVPEEHADEFEANLDELEDLIEKL